MKSQPCEWPFHDPALGLPNKPAARGGTPDDLKAQRLAGTRPRPPRGPRARVPPLSPAQPHPREAVRQGSHDAPGSVAIGRAGRMDDGHQQQPQHVNQEVARAPRHFLPRIIAAFLAAPLRRLHALRLQNRRWGPRVAPGGPPSQGTRAIVAARPHAPQPPPPDIAVDRRPRRLLPGQRAPGNAASDHRENGVEDQTHIRGSGSPPGVSGWDQGFDQMPFSVGQVARGVLGAHPPMLSQPTETF
jgi:hypothetical protein